MNNVQILVLDFGSQYTQLIARRLRECGVYTEIVPYFENIESIKAKNPKGIILSGGPASVYEEGAYKPDSKVFELQIPVLGICYGMQYIAYHFGGKVIRAKEQEFGKAKLEILDSFLVGHSALRDKSGSLGASCSHYPQGNSLESTLHNPNFSSQILECQKADDLDSEANTESLDTSESSDTESTTATDSEFATQSNSKDCGGALRDYCPPANEAHLGVRCSEAGGKNRANDYPRLNVQESEAELLTPLFQGVKQDSIVWMSHADKVEQIPSGFVELARSGNTHYCAIADCNRQIYALQFHPEVVHSECGAEILRNFAVGICGANTDWNMKNFIAYEIDKIRKITGLESIDSQKE